MSKRQSKLPDEAARFVAANPDVVAVDALFADLSGVVRGKRYPIAQLGKLMTGGIAIPGSVFLLDTAGASHDPCGYGFSDGDPDTPVAVAPGSLKRVPWTDPPGAQVLLRFLEKDGRPFRFEPRTVARRVLEQVHALGLRPVVAFELEFYLLDPERGPGGVPQAPISPLTGERDAGTQVYGMNEVDAYAPFLEEVRAACAVQDVPTGAMSAEYAPAQFEINLQHLDDPLLAADHCVLFKRIVKGVARRHGLQATFMAKPYAAQTGSGMHLHTSLLDDKGRNVFDGGKDQASAALKHALGGILALMPDAMGVYAPNVNSYRRFEPNLFVAVRRSWDFENRSVALRVPLGDGAARRIEHRIAGADANPYLVLAALLAGLHHGIAGEIDPGPPSEGNAGESYDPEIPFRPRRAFERLAGPNGLEPYFGREYLDVYAACKLAELDSFEAEIGPAEYRWYLQAE